MVGSLCRDRPASQPVLDVRHVSAGSTCVGRKTRFRGLARAGRSGLAVNAVDGLRECEGASWSPSAYRRSRGWSSSVGLTGCAIPPPQSHAIQTRSPSTPPSSSPQRRCSCRNASSAASNSGIARRVYYTRDKEPEGQPREGGSYPSRGGHRKRLLVTSNRLANRDKEHSS